MVLSALNRKCGSICAWSAASSALAAAFACTSSSPTCSSVESRSDRLCAIARSRSETFSAPSENRITEPTTPDRVASGATTADRSGQSRPSQPWPQPTGRRATRRAAIAATAPGGAPVPAPWWSDARPACASTVERSVTATAP